MAALRCQKCGTVLLSGSTYCNACGTKIAWPATGGADPTVSLAQPLPAALAVRPRTCVNCGVQMGAVGQVSFRTGGLVGGAGVLVGSWNAAAENLQPFSLYYCQRCGKFDLYYAGT